MQITYPCYLPLKEGHYALMVVDSHSCLPLLMGRSFVERFFKDRYADSANRVVEVQTVANREALLAVLRDLQAGFAKGEHQTGHVAFNPSGPDSVPYTTLREFIEFLESGAT